MKNFIKKNELSQKSLKANSNNELFNYFKNSPKYTLKLDSYFQVYQEIFEKFKNKKIIFIEVGVAKGGSLFMWKKYLGEQARIIGVEFNPEAKELEKHGFEIFIGDQSDENFWKSFYKEVGPIDILLDDGGHKNIQQIMTVDCSVPFINNGGMIIVEDVHTSYMKKSFGNPSKFSFINFCKLINDSINRRCSSLNKRKNIYSEKVFSINYYESIVVFNIDSEKCFSSSTVVNDVKDKFIDDFRHNSYFVKTQKFVEKKLNFLNKYNFFKIIIRNLFHRNIFFSIHEKIKLALIFVKLKR